MENVNPDFTIVSDRLNPNSVPSIFTRYRHPGHRHRLFMMTGITGRQCDHTMCKKSIAGPETIFSCFRCNFDLCSKCFQLDTEVTVPLSPRDAEVNETTVTPVTLPVHFFQRRGPRLRMDEFFEK